MIDEFLKSFNHVCKKDLDPFFSDSVVKRNDITCYGDEYLIMEFCLNDGEYDIFLPIEVEYCPFCGYKSKENIDEKPIS